MNNSYCSLETHVYSYSAGALASSLLVKESWRAWSSNELLSANNVNVKSFPVAQHGVEAMRGQWYGLLFAVQLLVTILPVPGKSSELPSLGLGSLPYMSCAKFRDRSSCS